LTVIAPAICEIKLEGNGIDTTLNINNGETGTIGDITIDVLDAIKIHSHHLTKIRVNLRSQVEKSDGLLLISLSQ